MNCSRSAWSRACCAGLKSWWSDALECCSEDSVWLPANSSTAVHSGVHNGNAHTHLARVLSVIPCPCVSPPETFIAHINTCSIVISDQTPLQNLSLRQMVKKGEQCRTISSQSTQGLLTPNVAGAVAGIRTDVAAIAWVSRPALNPPRHKSTPAARQTESDPASTTLFPLFYFWVIPVRLGPPPLPALTPDCSPPRPPILARLDPHTPCAWSALALNRGPPWLPIVVHLGPRFWPALTCYGRQLRNKKGGIVQYNQFAVDAGTSDTKCRRSHRWDSNPRLGDCLSQPSSTQPSVPQEYSGGEADRVWPSAYHTLYKPGIHFCPWHHAGCTSPGGTDVLIRHNEGGSMHGNMAASFWWCPDAGASHLFAPTRWNFEPMWR